MKHGSDHVNGFAISLTFLTQNVKNVDEMYTRIISAARLSILCLKRLSYYKWPWLPTSCLPSPMVVDGGCMERTTVRGGAVIYGFGNVIMNCKHLPGLTLGKGETGLDFDLKLRLPTPEGLIDHLGRVKVCGHLVWGRQRQADCSSSTGVSCCP